MKLVTLATLGVLFLMGPAFAYQCEQTSEPVPPQNAVFAVVGGSDGTAHVVRKLGDKTEVVGYLKCKRPTGDQAVKHMGFNPTDEYLNCMSQSSGERALKFSIFFQPVMNRFIAALTMQKSLGDETLARFTCK